MSLIAWVPLLDELDDAMFTYLAPDGWLPLNAWTGRDVYDTSHFYQLELTKGPDESGEIVTRAVIGKWKYLKGDRGIVKPGELVFDNIADAAGHLGFRWFDHRPLIEPYAAWIIELSEEQSQRMELAESQRVPG